jgi:hypothetical protein
MPTGSCLIELCVLCGLDDDRRVGPVPPVTLTMTPAPVSPAASVASTPLVRGAYPPDWRAAYVTWGVAMRRQLAGDKKALKILEAYEKELWRSFEAEVEGR